MKKYRVEIKPLSAFASKLQADTIWGHICWAILFTKGEKELKNFISSYTKESVPLLISNAFPSIKTDEKQIDYLPKPLVKPIDETVKNKFLQNFFNEKEERIFSEIMKKFKKQAFISVKVFEDKLKYAFSYGNLYELVFENKICPFNFSPKPENNCVKSFRECPFLITKDDKYDNECEYLEKLKIQKDEVVYRNVKDRITERVNAGGLFSSNYTFYPKNARLNIYIKTTLEDDFLYEIFDYIQNTGFGADKSVGKGQFTYSIYDAKLPECQTSNGFISLSNFFLTPDFKLNGFYEIEPKFPKMGETYANSGKPFKKPLFMIHAGAFFHTDKVYDFYGQLIKDVYSQDTNIVQYSYIFPMGVNVQ